MSKKNRHSPHNPQNVFLAHTFNLCQVRRSLAGSIPAIDVADGNETSVTSPFAFGKAPPVLDPLDSLIAPVRDPTIPRRQFLSGALACSVGFGLLGNGPADAAENLLCCTGADPLSAIRGSRFDALAAFFEAQLSSLFEGLPGDSSVEVANDALDFVRHLPRAMQAALCSGLAWLNFYSTLHTKQPFAQLSIQERWALLNQGESPPGY